MSEYTSEYILRYLDQPLRVIFWTIDEAVVLLFPLLVGLGADYFFTGLISSAIGYWALKRAKRLNSQGVLLHAVYWYLPTPKYKSLSPWNKVANIMPDSAVREYLG